MDNKQSKTIADIVSKAEIISKALKNGDVELRRGPNGVMVAEVKKTVIAK